MEDKKKVLFAFREKKGNGMEFIPADTISEAWDKLKEVLDKRFPKESTRRYFLMGGIE